MEFESRTATGRTAYGAAAVRAMEMYVPKSQRLFDDDVVVDFLPPLARFALRQAWIRKPFAALFDHGAPGVRGALLCRTRYIDDIVTGAVSRGLQTVTTLGAGLDTRPYRLGELAKKAQVLEIDLAKVQEFKKACLSRRFGALPQHVRFVPIDFSTEHLSIALGRGRLNPTEPAIFIWEGVTQYLQPDSVDSVLREVAMRAKGSMLVFTYLLEEVVTSCFRPDRGSAFRKSATRRPEPWHFGIDPLHLKTFLAARGRALRQDCGAGDHRERYLRPLCRELEVSEIECVALATV